MSKGETGLTIKVVQQNLNKSRNNSNVNIDADNNSNGSMQH